MSIAAPAAAVPRVALTVAEAAAASGVSEPTFRRWLLPHLRTVRIGSKTCILVGSLEKHLAELERAPAAAALEDPAVVGIFGGAA
jgi:hypothetical protein